MFEKTFFPKKLTQLLLMLSVGLNPSIQAQTYQAADTRNWDLLHTTLRITPNWESQQLMGDAELRLKPYFYAQNTVELDAKGFTIEYIQSKGQNIDYQYNGNKISIHLKKEFTRKDTLNLSIRYIAKPNELTKGGSDAITSDIGLYFITPTDKNKQQLWSQGETQANSCWFPTIDSPNEKHTHDIYLRVDNHLTTLSNGEMVEKFLHDNVQTTYHWKMAKPHAVYLTMIAVGNFVKTIDPNFKDFEVSYYVEPFAAPYAMQIFGRTPEMIRFYENLLGVPYQWNKYSQIAVREYVSGAMENTTATIHGDFVLKNPNQIVDNNDDAVIAHELFHHWFGDLVTCESWANLPLNESFADYSEYLWSNHKYGEDEGDWTALKALENYLYEATTKQVPLIRYYYENREDMFDSHSYSKGGRILHWLRREVGDEAFFEALHIYLLKNAYKTSEIHDLRMAFEEVTGRDLQWFFNQWFFQAGHPRLTITQEFQKNEVVLQITQKQDSANTFVYQLPLTVLIATKEGLQTEKILLTQASQRFSLKTTSTPTFVLIDPKGELVGEIEHVKTEKELQEQYYATKAIAGRLKALEALTFVPQTDEEVFSENPLANKDIRKLVLDATKDNFWGIRQRAVQRLYDYDGEDFLEVEKALQFVIKNDAHSMVRADAILAMKNFMNPQNDVLFRAALKDTAYVVRGAALESLLANKPPDAAELVKQFENIEDVNIFMAVANFYAEQGDPARYEWFANRIDKLAATDLYQVMGIFGTYLVSTDEDTKKKALPMLHKMASSHPQWFVRFSGVQTLLLLTDLPTVKEALQEIIKNETDERLKKVYEQMRN